MFSTTSILTPLPNAVTQHLPIVREDEAVRAVADLVSKFRYGCPSALLPVEHRELLISYIEELWWELDALSTGVES